MYFLYFQLAAQSQELYEHNLSLQEQKEALEKLASTEHLQGSQRLLRELSACVKDLHSLVQVCEHTMEGEEPNVSALLGLRCKLSVMNLKKDYFHVFPLIINSQHSQYSTCITIASTTSAFDL